MRFVVECFSEAGQLDLVLSHHILLVTADSWGEGSCCQHVIEILRCTIESWNRTSSH